MALQQMVDQIINQVCALNHRELEIATDANFDELSVLQAHLQDAIWALEAARPQWASHKRYVRFKQKLKRKLADVESLLHIIAHRNSWAEDAIFGTNRISEDPEFIAKFLAEPEEPAPKDRA